jgi:hypothetical protein
MRIDRCYCFAQRFADLQEVAERAGACSVPELQEAAEAEGRPFGMRCRLCHPYVRRMLRTGEAVFGQVVTEQDEPASEGAGSP